MAKLINKTQGYTVVNGNITKDHRLGIKERGLLVTLLSLPDEWEYSVLGLTKILPDGRDSIQASVKKLEKAGYLKRIQAKNDKGKFDGYDWEVTDEPFTENPSTENPSTDNPFTEKPTTENPPEYINNKSNKQKEITQEVSINQSIYQKEQSEEPSAHPPKIVDRLIDDKLIKEIKEQIEYDVLITAKEYHIDTEDLDAVIEAIAVLKTAAEPMKFGKSTYSPRYIRQRADMICFEHIVYVFECFHENKAEVHNIKKYLTTSVFNAPATINSFYDNRVRSDGVV